MQKTVKKSPKQAAPPKKVSAKLARSTASTATTNIARDPVVYLNLPADYTGDIWHVAAAMILCPAIQLIITRQSNKEGSKDMRSLGKALPFFANCGIAKGRIHIADVGQLNLDKGTEGKSQRDRDIQTAQTHVAEAQKAIGSMKLSAGVVYAVYSSTYMWVNAVMEKKKGKQNALDTVRAAFINGFEERQPRAARAIRTIVATLAAPPSSSKKIDESSPFVLVNMRMSNYHAEDNTSKQIYDQIVTWGARNNVRIIRVGAFNPRDKQHISEGGIWMRDLTTEVVDVYGFCEHAPGVADMQSVAYFWAVAAMQKNCLGVLGGRSGSSDVAGFSGFFNGRLMCWTKRRADDPGYQRQHLMVPHLMSLLDYAADELDYVPGDHMARSAKSKSAMPAQGLTIGVAMRGCFINKVQFAPALYGDMEIADSILHKMISGPSGQLTFGELGEFAFAIGDLPDARDGAPGLLTGGGAVTPRIRRLICLAQERNSCGQRAVFNVLAMMAANGDVNAAETAMADDVNLRAIGPMAMDIPDNIVDNLLTNGGGDNVAIISSLQEVQGYVRDYALAVTPAYKALHKFANLWDTVPTTCVIINTLADDLPDDPPVAVAEGSAAPSSAQSSSATPSAKGKEEATSSDKQKKSSPEPSDSSEEEESSGGTKIGHYIALRLERDDNDRVTVMFADSLRNSHTQPPLITALVKALGLAL